MRFTCRFILILVFASWSVMTQDILYKELLLSDPRTAFTSIEVDGKIYFPGGLNNREQASSAIDVFDIASQTWNNTLSLPSPRYYVTPAVVAPHLYFLGGSHTSFTTAAFQYDSSTKRMLATPNLDTKQPIQASLSSSSLVLVGSNGLHNVKFLNLTNIAAGWTINSALDDTMESIAGAVVFSHDDTIFIFGGVNVSSRLPLSDAWLYDIETNNLTHFVNALSPIGYSNTSQYTLSVTNNVLAAVLPNTGCTLFNVNTSTWLNLTVLNVSKVLSVPGFTFIFTSSGYYTVDWSSPRQDPVFSSVTQTIVHTVVYEEDLTYIVNNQNYLYSTMYCFSNGEWTSTNFTPKVAPVVASLEWPSYGAAVVTVDGIYIIDKCKVRFATQPRIKGIVVSHPLLDQLYVFTTTSDSETFNLYKYNGTLALLGSSFSRVVPQLCFDNILFDFKSGKAARLTDGQLLDIFSSTNATFNANSLWAARGNYLFVTNDGQSITTTSLQMDIYNYETDTWLNSTTLPYSPANYYAQAFNMNGALTVFTSTHRLSFNISTFEWDELLLAPFNYSLPDALFSPTVLEVDDVVYTTTDVVRLRIVQNGAVDFSLISDQNRPKQMIYNQAVNQILILTTANSIFTWNITNRQQSFFLFPRPVDTGVIMATGGTIVLASSLNKEQFDYCDLTIQDWDFVPGLDSYVHPSVMTPVTIADKEYLLIAGGTDKAYKFNSKSVRLIDVSVLETLLAGPATNPDAGSPSASPLSQQDVILIVAIVVPVGAVLLAGALLAFFLVRRQKKKKNGNHRMSTMGLEQQYGQWFIPFTSLTFHEQLGQGASGQVFKGTWNNTTVALKLSMTQANSSVIDELTLMMQLRPHPNVVQLLGFSVHPETDSIVLVIEYCNQGALDDILFNNNASVSLKQKVEWLIGIAKGLSHLHSNNVVHRDVAARNVLMHQNEAKLTDFGMSRIVDSQQQRGTTKSELGPIRWMSPESLKSKEYSTKSDVWSFGIVAYEIVAQHEPHTSADPIQVGRLIRDSGLTPQLPDTCSSELSTVIQSCWHMEPSKRPSIDAIVPQLETVQSQTQ